MQESEKILEIKQQDIKNINWFAYIKCPQIPLGTLMRLCTWIYEHVPYSEILNVRPIGDTNIYVTLNSPLTYFNTRNMAQAEINYVHTIINIVNIGQLQILLRFIRNYPMYSYM
jgi:hypothetical protein